ncbi:MAG TPA: extracellular solute-binding protein [Gaiellaceae bacterium]|nr:extracellular solute-binding protein [Gaiellaceae bacterium]
MKSKGKAMKVIRLGMTVAAVSLLAVATGSISTAATHSSQTVTISVASLIPGSTKAATQQFNNQVAEFEKANPSIKVKPVEYQWTGPTFAAKLAAGTLPTVFEVPFTDARALGDNGQLADLTAEAKALPYFSKYNKAVIAEGTDSKGQIVALPKGAYAQALHYNRKLFTQAGLDPNKPPTTWAQVEADAKQIAQKTGQAGYAEMGKDDNTAGWILTTLVYALGGRMETGTGTNATATLDNPQTVTALNMLKKMRWTDNSMGSNFDYGWSDINQAFAAGQVGMYVSGSDVYTNLVQASNINPSIYGLAPIPLAKNKNAGVLGGGTLAAVRPDANAATRAAAMKWIDFFYEQPLINKAQAIRNAKTLVASKQPVGVPALPVFDKAQYDLANTWIKPYINVPLGQMKPFTTGIFSQTLVPEPEASTQSIYHSLDAVVEAVLTDQNTDIASMLKSANSAAQSAIKQGT